jgi:hypothetical protein
MTISSLIKRLQFIKEKRWDIKFKYITIGGITYPITSECTCCTLDNAELIFDNNVLF